LDIKQIPGAMKRMMEPNTFVDEMRERMALAKTEE
jgi:hypothetical protein